MVWGVSYTNNTGLDTTLTPFGNTGSADRFIQVTGYHSICIQEAGDRVRRTGTTWAVVVFDGVHNFEVGYEGGPRFNFVLTLDPNLGVRYSVDGRPGTYQLPLLPDKPLADRSAVWLYTRISGLVIDVTSNSSNQSPSLQRKLPRSGATVGTQLWVWSKSGQIVNTGANKCLSTDGTTVNLVSYQPSTTPPAEQVWMRVSLTGRIQNSKYPNKVLRPDRPQLTTPAPPSTAADAWGYGYNVGASLILANDSPMWQPKFFDGPELREWCLIPPGFAQPIFYNGGSILDKLTAAAPDFNQLTSSQLWYHSRTLIINDEDGKTLGINPIGGNWYPIGRDNYDVTLVSTQSPDHQFGGTRWAVKNGASNQLFNLQAEGPFYFSARDGPMVYNFNRLTTTISNQTDWSFGNTYEWQWLRGPDLRNAAFIDLTVAPSGFLVGLTSERRMFYSNGNLVWKELPRIFNSGNSRVANVTLGLPSMLYAILDNGSIYKLAKSTDTAVWTMMPAIAGGAKYVSCGVDNNLWCITNNNKVFTLDGTAATLAWVDVTATSPANMSDVSAGTHDNVWALDNTGKVWRWNPTTSTWVDGGATNLQSVQVGVDGSVFGITTAQNVVRYRGISSNSWQTIPGHVKSLAVASSNLVLSISYVEGFFRYRPLDAVAPPTTTTRFHTFSAGTDDSASGRTGRTLGTMLKLNATHDEIKLCVGMAAMAYSSQTEVDDYLTKLSYVPKVYVNNTSNGTQAFVAWNSSAKILVISFRGTETDNNADIITDFSLWASASTEMLGHGPVAGRVPRGFGDAYSSAKSSIWTAVKGVVDDVGISVVSRLYVTGHSLGAALATYCAADMAVLLKENYNFTNRGVLKMINFGGPYTADDVFYDFFTNGLAHSITAIAVINERDPVPYLQIPVASWPWRRLGEDYILYNPNSQGGRVNDALYSHSIYTYSALISDPGFDHTAIRNLEVQITTGSSSFGWLDEAGTDRSVSILFGNVVNSGLANSKPSTIGTVKQWNLRKIVVDDETGLSGYDLKTFEDSKTDTFKLDQPFLLNSNEVSGFVLGVDTSTTLGSVFGFDDNWLVTGIQIKLDGAVRYNKTNLNVKLGPDFSSYYSDNLTPLP